VIVLLFGCGGRLFVVLCFFTKDSFNCAPQKKILIHIDELKTLQHKDTRYSLV
jgi:hypothetical protein